MVIRNTGTVRYSKAFEPGLDARIAAMFSIMETRPINPGIATTRGDSFHSSAAASRAITLRAATAAGRSQRGRRLTGLNGAAAGRSGVFILLVEYTTYGFTSRRPRQQPRPRPARSRPNLRPRWPRPLRGPRGPR